MPNFASFVLLANNEGHQQLKKYYVRYLALARTMAPGSSSIRRFGAQISIGA